MIDLSNTGQMCKRYSDSVLKGMSKAELIEQIRLLEDSYDEMVMCNIRQAQMLDRAMRRNKKYQHDYYERVTKPKRIAERQEQEHE